MKKAVLICLLFLYLCPKTQAQDDGAAVAGAVVGGLLAIGAGIAAVEAMKEQAELTATQWVLSNQPEMNSFLLKTLDFDGKKLKDMSNVSVITYKIQEFTPAERPEPDGRKQVLFMFTSRGWINEYGIDFNKVRWHLIDVEEWTRMMTSYVLVASDETDAGKVRGIIQEGKIVNRGVKVKSSMEIPFYKMEGDMYVVTDYSQDMKLVYNERSLGIFLKETQDLVQIGRGDIIKIHDFFFEEE